MTLELNRPTRIAGYTAMARRLRPTTGMRDLEVSLPAFGEFLLKAKLVREKSAPHVVRWVRRFLSAPASQGALADQARRFRDDLERSGRDEDWQVRQAEQAVRMHFVNFLRRPDWHRPLQQ